MKPLKIVLTGGPCAGKTTLTQVVAKSFPANTVIVPEAASMLFSAGFPRWPLPEAVRATQRTIFHLQNGLETAYSAQYLDKILVLDRGVIDGAAYWPEGPDDYFRSLNTSLDHELSRYDKVIYLESAAREDYILNQSKNPSRQETWEEAMRLDAITRALWEKHPAFTVVKQNKAFQIKVMEVLGEVGFFLPVNGLA